MARRKHHRRRRSGGFHGMVSIPALGALNPKKILSTVNPLGKTVKATDVLIGAAAGMIGAGFAKKAINSVWKAPPEFVRDNIDLVAAALVAVGAGLALGGKNASKASGISFGALLSGLVPTAWVHVRKSFPTLAGMEDLDLNGFLVSDQDRALKGFLVNDSGQMNGFAEGHMNELAAHATGEDEDDVLALRALTPAY